MSNFRFGDTVVYVGDTFSPLRGLIGTIIGHASGLLTDSEGQYRVEFKSDGKMYGEGYCYSLLPTSLCLVPGTPKVDVTAKPGDKVKFLVEGTIIREDDNSTNWVINAPLFWGTGETRHIRKESVAEVTKSLTFEIGEHVHDDRVHLLPLGTVLRMDICNFLVVVGVDGLISMRGSITTFKELTDNYYTIVSLPKET